MYDEQRQKEADDCSGYQMKWHGLNAKHIMQEDTSTTSCNRVHQKYVKSMLSNI
jgi:hypothetical protein